MVDLELAKQEKIIALIGCDESISSIFLNANFGDKQVDSFINAAAFFAALETNSLNFVGIVSQSEVLAPSGIELLEILQKKKMHYQSC